MEDYGAARRACLRSFIPAMRGEAELDLDAVKEAAISVSEDVAEDVGQVFEECAADEPAETLKGVISALKEKEVSAAMELVEPTSEELSDLALACEKLWKLDYNRLEAGAEFVVNFQDDTRGQDAATEALFGYVDGQAMSQPTITSFYKLLDNYVSHAGESEEVTEEEAQEIRVFMDNIMQTAVMQYVYKYLDASGRLPGDVESEEDFKSFLYKAWFFFYSKEAKWDSSGFEHVFVGDVRHDKVGGMHNWIQLLVEERRGNLNYLGFIPSRGVDGDEVPGVEYVMSICFDWKGVRKAVGSSFFGTSPEFEFALYSLCAFAGKERNPAKLADRYNVDVVCYTFSGKIGTSYPHVHGMDDDE